MSESSRPEVCKVCGVTRPEDAEHAVAAGANAIGMIFFPPSPRSVELAQAQRVAEAVPPTVRRVGVFVGDSAARIQEAVRQVPLDVVQLHGDERPGECSAIRQAVGDGIELWKAVRAGDGFVADSLADFDVDAFLLDSARDGMYGGTGETFDWQLAVEAKRYGRVVLSGGLDGSNVADAIHAVQPWGVDASSRLEAAPGIKDRAKVDRFLRAAL